MAQYVDDLEDYNHLENTKSCYLDGRYFNRVFENYPGLLSNPMHIDIRTAGIKSANRDERKEIPFVSMRDNNIKTHTPGLLRLVISTPETRHSNLLILDYDNGKLYRFEPLGKTAPYYEQVNDIIASYFVGFFPLDLEVVDLEFSENSNEILDEKNPACKKSGFCVAYNILFAYSYLKQIPFDPNNIRKFATLIETKYGPLPEEGAEVEYGPQSYYNRGGHGRRYGRGYGGYGRGYGGYGIYPPIIGGFGYPAYGYGVPGYGYPGYGYGYPGYGYGNTGVVLGSLLGGALGAAVSGL